MSPINPLPISGNIELVVGANGEVRQAGADRAGDFITDTKRNAENSLYFFGKVIMGYDLMTKTLHMPLCDMLQSSPPYRKLILFPRGHLKTTVLKALALHCQIQSGEPVPGRRGEFSNVYFPHGIGALPHAHGTSTRLLLASKSADLARSTLSEIMVAAETNELLHAFWPQCFWGNTKDARWWNQERIVFPRTDHFKEASIETIGVGGQITGYHFNLHIFDDLIDLNDANSRTTMYSTIEWWKASRALMDDPDKSLEFIVGTRWAVNDLYEYIIKKDPSVEPLVRRIVEDGVPIFPERFSLDTVARLQREFQSLFPLLYMNSATDPTLTDFDMDKVRNFVISDNCVCYEESTDDLLAADRRNTAREFVAGIADADGKRRALKFNKPGYDTLIARNEYLHFKRTRGE